MVQKSPSSARTPKKINTPKKQWWIGGYVAVFLILMVTYVLATLFRKPNPEALHQFHLTADSYHALIDSILIITLVIWVASLFGSLFFKVYAWPIRGSKDGKALNVISNGLIVLSIAQPLGSCLSSLAVRVEGHHPGWIPTLTITLNYINLALVGLAMALIAIGAERLFALSKRKISLLIQRAWVPFFVIFSGLYSYFIVVQPIHTPLARRAYFLPDWLLVCTIAIPYVIFWYLGIYAAYQINHYQKNVRGLLYKNALNYLAAGILVVIAASVVVRIITTTSTKLTQLNLTPILFIIYGLLLLDALGFILIAIGANKLRKIEQV